MKTSEKLNLKVTQPIIKRIESAVETLDRYSGRKGTSVNQFISYLKEALSKIVSQNEGQEYLEDEKNISGANTLPYKIISRYEFENVHILLIQLKHEAEIGNAGSLTYAISNGIYEIWQEIAEFNNISLESSEFELKKMTLQLYARQNELNIRHQEVLKDLEERSKSASTDITQLAKKYVTQTHRDLEDITEERKEVLHQFIVDNQNQLNNAIRKTSSEAILEIQKSQTSAQQSFDEHISKIIGSINKRVDAKISSYDEQKSQMEIAFKQKIEAVENLISIVTSGVMADQHIKQANTERNVYWALQVFGFLFMIAAIYSGSVFFSEITNIRLPFLPKPDLVIHVDGAIGSGQNPTTLMFMRLSMIILLTAPAIYLLKEAAVHRHKENLYRQRGIQLATISPYLEELEKEERAAIKKELVASFFQFHDGKADTQNVPDFIRDMREMVGIAKSINGQKKTMRERLGRK
ncbi:TPA: hypothetical protein ACVOYS_001301 [Vibrio alginolyticus]